MTRRLGYREVQVVAALVEARRAGEPLPSYTAICDATGISTRGEVSRIITRLKRRGHHPH